MPVSSNVRPHQEPAVVTHLRHNMDAEHVYTEIQNCINSGTIAALSRDKLTEFSVALARSQAYTYFGASEFPQICETVRALLLTRSAGVVPGPASSPPADIKDKTKEWHDKPLGKVGIGLFIAVLAFLAIYLLRSHLGIPS